MEMKKFDLDSLTKFVIDFWKETGGDIKPTLIFGRDRKDAFAVVVDSRSELKAMIDVMVELRPKFVFVVFEAYMREISKDDTEMLERLKKERLSDMKRKGEKVDDVCVIQYYTKSKKVMRKINKKDFTYDDIEDFDGFLVMNDLDRIFGLS